VTLDLIKKSKTIFWDFDGVIKDSVSVKSDAFVQLFQAFGTEVTNKVKEHHERNGGMSRYEKLPIYLNWAEEELSEELTYEYERKFSQLVKQKVINSPWINGVLEYLQKNYKRQCFFLVTATPQQEIEEILKQLQIDRYFKYTIGSPTGKTSALKRLLDVYNVDLQQAIMVGDSNSDYEAARENQVEFVLRKTELNKKLQEQLNCKTVDDFLNG
jgi:HAD superfamily hydrolase (TIGR01549 family)